MALFIAIFVMIAIMATIACAALACGVDSRPSYRDDHAR